MAAFLTELLASATPDAHGEGLMVRTLLDEAAATIPGRFADTPVVRARLLDALGEAYRVLGLYDESSRFLREALEIRKAEPGPRHELVAESLDHCVELAWSQSEVNSIERAEAEIRTAIDIRTEKLGANHEATISSKRVLAKVMGMQGRSDEALTLLLRLQNESTLVADHPTSIAVAVGIETLRRNEKSIRRLLEQADLLTIEQQVRLRIALAMRYTIAGHFEEAAREYEIAEDFRKQYYTTIDVNYLKNRTEYANTLRHLGRLNEARDLLVDILKHSRQILGERNAHTLWTAWSLALVLRDSNDHEAALPILEHAVYITDRKAPGFLVKLAEVHEAMGNPVLTQELYTEAKTLPVLGKHDW